MIVLHAIWDSSVSGMLHIWAESSDLAVFASRRKRVQGEGEKLHTHPFALPVTVLQEVVNDLAGSLLVQDVHAGSLNLRLPSNTQGPLSSPELILDEPRSEQQAAELQWWQVITLQLDASRALDLLLRLPLQAPRGVAFGSSLCFWAEVAKFAFELVGRQCFIPTLYQNQRGGTVVCRATWEALLSPDDSQRLRLLASALPPLCWAFMPAGEKPVSLLQEVVRDFLNQSIDAYVRESLASTSLLPAARRKRTTMPLPERWLRALCAADATVGSTPAELLDFAATLRSWLDQVQLAPADTVFRTCFKLDAPAEDEEGKTTWRVSYHLQASDDPSLLIPAEQVWQERSGTLTFLKRKFENPQERLLADLGKATRLFPAIDASLHTARPEFLDLSTEQAYGFLRETTPLLEDSGFGVLIPPWWSKPTGRVSVKMRIKPQTGSATSTGLMGMNSIVDYSWDVAIGDTTLTPDEFAHLVNLKQPLVKVRGQWVELRPEQIEAAIAFFEKKRKKKEITLGEALRVGLGEGQSEIGLPVTGIETEGWIKDILDQLYQDVPFSQIEQPALLQGTLRPYQLKGVSWLAFLKQFGFGSCLADDMGLGKSVELIALLLNERKDGENALQLNPTLLICPMSIVGNWQREMQRFAPSLSVMIHHGMERLSGQDFIDEACKHDVVITTYTLALRDKEHLNAIDWECIVIDEAQNIKNESAKQTQAIKSLAAKYRIALTGTPVENRLSELWSIMEFLNPGYLGAGKDFRQNFALPIERYHDAERSNMLKRLIQPFVLRRLKTDKTIIQDLPDKLEMKVLCNLTQEQASLYEAVVKEMLERIEKAEGIERRGLILSALMKLKQICNHPAHFMKDSSSLPRRSGKLARLEEMLEEVLASGEKALIFTQFAEMGTLLKHHLQENFGVETLFLHGAVQKKQRDLLVERFQESGRGAPLFILSLKAGGVGLNLTAANHVFHFDRWWNPAVEDQATDRAFRIGQQKNVQVHKFVCVGTLEERIDQMIEQKKELAESIVGAGENWLTEMSTSQLKEMFALSREAVGE